MFQDQCAKQTIEQVFLSVSDKYHSLGLSEFASYDRRGVSVTDDNKESRVTEVVFPFELTFKPDPDVAARLEELMASDPDLPWYD